jgi:pimeloyl-ACP methyl ester carboxylesterase
MVSRRELFSLPLLVAGTSGAIAQPAMDGLISEDFMIPADEAGIQLFIRNKRKASLNHAAPNRTLLYVHGLTYSSSATFDLPLAGQSWMGFIAAHDFDVWCLDLRGYGRSTRPPAMSGPPDEAPPQVRSKAGMADLAAAVAFIRDRRGIAKLDLMGWSGGTLLTAAFAAENPAAVERLVLYAPVWLRQGPPRDVEREITSFAIDRVPPSVHAAPVGRIGSH